MEALRNDFGKDKEAGTQIGCNPDEEDCEEEGDGDDGDDAGDDIEWKTIQRMVAYKLQ